MRYTFLYKSILFLTIFSFFAIYIPYGHMPSDTLYSIATADALCHGKVSIEKTNQVSNVIPGKSGNYYSKYGIGYAILFIPSVVATECLHYIIHIPRARLLQGIASLTNTLIATICMMLFIKLFHNMGLSKKIIVITSIVIASGSMLLPYSKINHAETPTLLILLIFFLYWQKNTKLNIKTAIVYGSCIGFLLLLKASNIIDSALFLCCCGYLIITGKCKKSISIILCGIPLITVLFLLWFNWYRFGSLFNYGYGIEQNQFTTPFSEGLNGLLLSPSKSIFIFSPLIILSIYGLVISYRNNIRLSIPVVLLFICNFLFFLFWHDWHGGWSWGPRLLVPVLVLMHLFIPYSVQSILSSFTKHKNRPFYRILLPVFFLLCYVPSVIINNLGALVWYQQVYYFHKDYTSTENAHPLIAWKLFKNKLDNKSEMYTCSDFKRDCTKPPYTEIWNNVVHEKQIDFTLFETFCGFSTFWGALRYHTHLIIFSLLPVGLFITSICGVIFLYRNKTIISRENHL
jgi:hypothetical protein